MYQIQTGPAGVGHLYGADEIDKAVALLVHHYAHAMNLDVHPAEARLYESRALDSKMLPTGHRTIEVRVASQIVGTLAERGR